MEPQVGRSTGSPGESNDHPSNGVLRHERSKDLPKAISGVRARAASLHSSRGCHSHCILQEEWWTWVCNKPAPIKGTTRVEIHSHSWPTRNNLCPTGSASTVGKPVTQSVYPSTHGMFHLSHCPFQIGFLSTDAHWYFVTSFFAVLCMVGCLAAFLPSTARCQQQTPSAPPPTKPPTVVIIKNVHQTLTNVP